MKRSTSMVFGLLGWALSAMVAPAIAQDNYPSAPIKVVVGYPPGGTTDALARLVAQKLAAQMNTTGYAENKPGANGNIGAEFVAKSKPDGNTLLLNTASVVLSPAFGEKLGYDVLKDLLPIAHIATSSYAIVTHPAVPANTVAEFIAHLRANPDKLAYGSGGTGSGNHLAALLFLQANGLSALHVPYKGSAPVTLDLVGGRIQFGMQSLPAVIPMLKDKRIKALAFTSLKRSPLLPDLPTLNESVMPGFEVGGWYGVMAPANTSPAIVKRLNAEIVKVMQDPTLKTLEQDGTELLRSTPEEYGTYVKRELERWTKVIKSAGVKLE